MGFMDKVRRRIGRSAGKIESRVDKVGDVIDDKTGGQHTDKIHKVRDAAKGALDKLSADGRGRGRRRGRGRGRRQGGAGAAS